MPVVAAKSEFAESILRIVHDVDQQIASAQITRGGQHSMRLAPRARARHNRGRVRQILSRVISSLLAWLRSGCVSGSIPLHAPPLEGNIAHIYDSVMQASRADPFDFGEDKRGDAQDLLNNNMSDIHPHTHIAFAHH